MVSFTPDAACVAPLLMNAVMKVAYAHLTQQLQSRLFMGPCCHPDQSIRSLLETLQFRYVSGRGWRTNKLLAGRSL